MTYMEFLKPFIEIVTSGCGYDMRSLSSMVFVSFFPFLSILVTSVYIGTVEAIYFSVFSSELENCPSNSSASLFMIK